MSNRVFAENVVKDMQRVSPYMYEGLYGNFLRAYMESDRSKWTEDLGKHLGAANGDWRGLGDDIADLLWEQFERRISC